ncbi:MAG: hypothetical protein HFH47_02245, partial [Bacilli bacterium]|nr:hypothetical protein [Bacilli bacterium]
SGISKYEYSKDNGATWIDGGSNNVYTFTNLNQGTAYPIKVRVTSKIGKQTTSEVTTVTTNTLKTPIFTDGNLETTITYEEGCGDTLTCTYKYNDKEEIQVTSKTILVPITEAGNIVAKVTDGKNIENSTHMVLYNDLYVSNSGNDNTGYGTKDKPYATLNKAYSMTSESASIKVMNNITANETITFNQNKNITLTSYTENNTNNSIVRGNALTEAVLKTTEGTLNLENIIIDGNNVEAQSALLVQNSGDVNINTGTTIKNGNNINETSTKSGGGIHRLKGLLTINDGEIINNKAGWGGGIKCGKYYDETEAVLIKGGKISNNESNYGGGINGYISMSSGEVSNNNSKVSGGGILIGDGSSNITGGKIISNTSNSGGGIVNAQGNLTISGNTLIDGNRADNNGGGINFSCTNDCKLIIKGGQISNNNSGHYGGGIIIFTNKSINATLEISGNALIDSNTSNSTGGGVFSSDSTTVNIIGGKISKNKSITNNGGGMHTGGVVNMSGGEISGNSTDHSGGGVTHCSHSLFTMTGGVIKNNNSKSGAGVHALGPFVLDGGIIRNNSSDASNGGITVSSYNDYKGTYTYKKGTVCGNTPTNSYETHTTCPAS